MENLRKTKKIIEKNAYLVLGTCRNDIPWTAPLFYASDKSLDFYFVSGKETRHVKDLEENSNVSVTIFDSQATPEEADGIYIEGTARQVAVSELPKAIKLIYKKRFTDPSELKKHVHEVDDFLGHNPRRFYKIKTGRIYKLDTESTSEVDKRVEIDIEKMREIL